MTLPRKGHPTKITNEVQRVLFRKGTKRLRVTLKKLERPKAQMRKVVQKQPQPIHSSKMGFMVECRENSHY